MHFLLEAGIVGLGTVIVGLLFWVVGFYCKKRKMPKNLLGMSIILFLTGVTVHILAEVSKINKWYCQHGDACLEK